MHVDFKYLPYWVNKAFYPLWFDRNRFIIKKGSAGSGKSVDTFRCATYRMTSEPGHNYLVVRKSAKSNGTSTYPLMKSCISDWKLWPLFEERKTTQTIKNKHNGNEMRFMGLDDVEKIKSITFENGPLTDIIVEEATETSENDFKQLNLRLRGLARQPFQITMMFNPISATHWIKKRFFDNPGGKKDRITIHESTYLDNRFIDEEYKEQLEQLKDEDYVYYQIYALGHWGVIGNTVFSNYVIEDFELDYNDFDDVVQGQDYGFHHPFAFELLGFKDGELYIFDEIHQTKRTNNELIEDAKNYFTQRGLYHRVRNNYTTGDSAEPDRITEWNQAGFRVNSAKKGTGSVKFGIDFLKRHKIHIHKTRCPGIAGEIPLFKYREDKDGNVLDEFVNFKDDGIAAARYATEHLWANKSQWGFV